MLRQDWSLTRLAHNTMGSTACLQSSPALQLSRSSGIADMVQSAQQPLNAQEDPLNSSPRDDIMYGQTSWLHWSTCRPQELGQCTHAQAFIASRWMPCVLRRL